MYITHSDIVVNDNPVMSVVTIESRREAVRIIKAIDDPKINSDLWCDGVEVFYCDKYDINYLTGSYSANVRFKYEGKYFCFSYKIEDFNNILFDEMPIIAFQLEGRNNQPFKRYKLG